MAEETGVLRFGVFELDLESGELRKSGVKVRLAPQPVRLLALLACRAQHVVPLDEIRTALWKDGTFVEFEQGIVSCIAQIRRALGDDARSPRYVETLHKRGYRFLVPAASEAGSPSVRLFQVAAGRCRGSEAPTIAVLPIESLSGSPDEHRLAAGLTDALISRAAQCACLRVISRTSAMQFRGSRRSLPEIAKRLGADWVMEGSIVSEGNRARINVQLVNGETDTQLWAGSYQPERKDELKWERRMSRTIVRHIRLVLARLDVATPRFGADSEAGRRVPRLAAAQAP